MIKCLDNALSIFQKEEEANGGMINTGRFNKSLSLVHYHLGLLKTVQVDKSILYQVTDSFDGELEAENCTDDRYQNEAKEASQHLEEALEMFKKDNHFDGMICCKGLIMTLTSDQK